MNTRTIALITLIMFCMASTAQAGMTTAFDPIEKGLLKKDHSKSPDQEKEKETEAVGTGGSGLWWKALIGAIVIGAAAAGLSGGGGGGSSSGGGGGGGSTTGSATVSW